MTSTSRLTAMAVAGVLSGALLSGCATPVKPDDLKAPQQPTCAFLDEPMSFTGRYGGLKVMWKIRLEKGPYWSEGVDDQGIYYRAPTGGVSITGENGAGFPGQPPALDGGFYVPNDPGAPVKIYRYFTASTVAAQSTGADMDCSTIGFMKDPSTSKVSILSFAAGGAAGGAAAGIGARSLATGSQASPAQTGAAGAAGGLVGGALIAAIINADVGKIVPAQPPLTDVPFMNALRALAARGVPVRETPFAPVASEVRSAPPGTVK